MLWGCMKWGGVVYVTKIEGKMENELQQTLEFWGKTTDDVVFQQDNDPKHTSKKAKKWFEDNNVLKWPALSPDLTPIEHLWHHLKKKLGEYEEPANSVTELWERVQEEWDKIPKEEYQKLIESMPKRLAAVVRTKGGYTKY